jgi:aminoglycoside phosphotransferase
VIVPDVIHAVLHDHDQMRRLCTDLRQADGADKKRLFAELYQVVNVHELGDLAVVHPAARGNTANGDRTAVACMTEGADIARALAELHALGVEHATFDGKLAAVHQAIRDHTAHEERDEFPVLRRYVSIQRLHMMAGELHDVQVMGTH